MSDEPRESTDAAETGQDTADFLRQVRQAAGWRVAPRHLEAARQALAEIGEEPTPERVAELATEFHGARSQRQRRNPDLWRLLGAQLTARGKPGDPDAQQAFIGRARAECRGPVNDALLLTVATSLANANHALTPVMTGQVTDWLIERFDLDEAEDVEGVIEANLDEAVEATLAERSRDRPPRRRRAGEYRPRRNR
jgi:hypothetical protein